MRSRIRAQHYKTENAARRYANELKRVWPDVVQDAYPSLSRNFDYVITVIDKTGRKSIAGKRPPHFGRQ